MQGDHLPLLVQPLLLPRRQTVPRPFGGMMATNEETGVKQDLWDKVMEVEMHWLMADLTRPVRKPDGTSRQPQLDTKIVGISCD